MGKEITNPAYTAPPSNTISPYLTLVYHRDHLAGVRAITKTDGTILEQNDYYPFGLRTTRKQTYITLSQSLASATAPRYLYNGKEKQEFIHNTGSVLNPSGSATYTSNNIDYGARFYNPVTLRWTTQDPLAEKYQRYSPYNYCVNSPINFVDPNGMEIIIEGKMTELVIQQLQGIVQDYLLLSINSQSKRLEYTFKNENIEIKDELVNRLKTIIDDKTIHVEISAIELNKCAGGMFLGNNVGLINSDIIYARQAVDPTRLSDIDNYSGEQIGTHLMHEITEAYEGALITKEKKLKGILPADKEKYKKDYKYYLEAHK